MFSFIEKYLIENGIAFVIFDSDLCLLEKSKNFTKISHIEKAKKGESLFYIFPEFYGSENEISSIQSGIKESFSLIKINKYVKNKLYYLDYFFTLYDKTSNIVLFISDSTFCTSLEQKIKQQQNELNILKERLYHKNQNFLENIWGESKKIKSLKENISKIAKIKGTTILLTGESGTGKTLVARAIHSLSENSEAPFVEINCATIPDSLIESEIFGHVKGAFTNALENKKGLIEEANSGTLFLDEIGELPINLQPKLLSVLESKKFRQLGSNKEISVNTRIIAATNKDLKKAIEEKEFRDDLYYRINVISLEIPSLRERNDDILLLAEKFIEIISTELNKNINGFTERAKKKLVNYDWPGNIRELKNIIERALIFCETEKLDDHDLIISESDLQKEKDAFTLILTEEVSLDEIEKKYLENAIKQTNGNQTKAAKLLGLSSDKFRYRIKKHNISL